MRVWKMTEQVDKGAYATQDAIGDQRTGSVGWGRGDVRRSPGAVRSGGRMGSIGERRSRRVDGAGQMSLVGD